jgi:hypothetical protein
MDFNFDAIKGGFFGERTEETRNSAPTVQFDDMSWAGWITGTDAVVKLFMQYYYTLTVSVDGGPYVQVTGVSLGSNTYAVTLFAGLPDVPHFVQFCVGTNGTTHQGIFTQAVPNGTTVPWPMSVTGAAPAVEGLCTSAAIAWNPLDPAFPGTTALIGSPADCMPWQANTPYGTGSRIVSNGLVFNPDDESNQTRMSGNDAAKVPTTEQYYIGGDGAVSWKYSGVASAIAPRRHFNPNPSASAMDQVKQLTGFPKGQIGDAGAGGGATLFRGKAAEVWARVNGNVPTVFATGGTANILWYSTFAATAGVAGSVTVNRGSGEGPLQNITAAAIETGSLPTGFSISRTNSSVTISWSTAVAAGRYVIPVRVTTAIGDTFFTAVAMVKGATGTPVFGGPFAVAAVVGTPFSYTLAPSDASHTISGYAVDVLPDGLTLDTTTGIITGTPTTANILASTFTVTNATGTSKTVINFSVTTAGAPVFPELENAIGKLGVVLRTPQVVGRTFPDYQVRATNTPTSFAVSPGGDPMPAGLTLDTATGWIRGTPTTAGKAEVAIIASNGAGSSLCIVSLQIVSLDQYNGGLLATTDRWFNSQVCWSVTGRPVADAPLRYASPRSTKLASGAGDGRVTAFDPNQQMNTTQPVWVMLANDIDPTVENTFMVYDHLRNLDGIMLRLPGGTPTMVPLKTETSIQFGDSVTAGFSPTVEGAFIATEFNIAAINCGVSAEKLRTAIQRVQGQIEAYDGTGHKINYVVSAFGRNDGGKRPNWETGLSITVNNIVESGGNCWAVAMAPYPAALTSTVDPATISPTGPRGDEGGTIGADGIPWYPTDFAFTQTHVHGATWQPTVLSANIPGGTSFYRTNTLVQKDGHVYCCDANGTSVEGPAGTTTGAGSITEATGTATWHCVSASADWAANTDYAAGDIVWSDGQQYACVLPGKSGTVPPAGLNEGKSYADAGAVVWRIRSTHSVWTAGNAVGAWSRVSSDIGGGVIRYYAVYGTGTASASEQPTFTGAIGTRGHGAVGGTNAPGADGVSYSYEGDNITDYPPYALNTTYATGGGASLGLSLYTAVRGGRTSSSATYGPGGPTWMYNNYTDGIWWQNVSRRAYGSTAAHPYNDMKVWLPRQDYRLWDIVFNAGRAYQCHVAGRSASSGGPTGTDGVNHVTDGTCEWVWISWTTVGQLLNIFRNCRALNTVCTARQPGSYANQSGQGASWIPGLREIQGTDSPAVVQYLDATWGAGLGPDWQSDWGSGDYLHPSPEGYAQLGSLLSRDLAERLGRRHNFAFGM